MLYLISFLILLLDQATKYAASKALELRGSIPVVAGIFNVTLVHNTGAGFGVLKGFSLVFIVVSLLAIIFFIYALKKHNKLLNNFQRLGVSFILGGTLGNLIDRLRLGYVIDFLDFIVWPVFNVADTFISVGAGLIIINMFFCNKEGDTKQ